MLHATVVKLHGVPHPERTEIGFKKKDKQLRAPGRVTQLGIEILAGPLEPLQLSFPTVSPTQLLT
jgi:hypothetical protein